MANYNHTKVIIGNSVYELTRMRVKTSGRNQVHTFRMEWKRGPELEKISWPSKRDCAYAVRGAIKVALLEVRNSKSHVEGMAQNHFFSLTCEKGHRKTSKDWPSLVIFIAHELERLN